MAGRIGGRRDRREHRPAPAGRGQVDDEPRLARAAGDPQRAAVLGHHGGDDREPEARCCRWCAPAPSRRGRSARRRGAAGRPGCRGRRRRPRAAPPRVRRRRSGRRPTVTCVPGGVWVRALASRLATTWCSRSGSPTTSGTTRPRPRPRPGRSSAQRCSRRRGVGVGDGVDDHPGEVDALARQGPAGVEAGEQQQVLDQRGHPLGLRPHPLEQARDLAGQLVGAARGELVVPADRGERGAQLVAGVGDEAPQPGLALLAGGEGGADVAEHPVERRADLADLGARVGVDVGHPVGELDLARGQRQLRDPARGRRDAVQRAQGQPGGDGRGHAGDHDADPEDDRLAEHQLADGVLQRVGGQADDGDGAVLARGGGEPEAAEPLEVDGARRLAGRRRDRRRHLRGRRPDGSCRGRPSTTARTTRPSSTVTSRVLAGTVRAPADEAAARVRRGRPAIGSPGGGSLRNRAISVTCASSCR